MAATWRLLLLCTCTPAARLRRWREGVGLLWPVHPVVLYWNGLSKRQMSAMVFGCCGFVAGCKSSSLPPGLLCQVADSLCQLPFLLSCVSHVHALISNPPGGCSSGKSRGRQSEWQA